MQVSAQSDDPAAASGYIEDSLNFWTNTPQLIISPTSQLTLLPDEVNNSDYFYFPRKEVNGVVKKFIYEQLGTGSCAAVASVFYTFSYEINRVRGVPGLFDENKYPPNFTWNFLNGGDGSQGSTFEDNLDILMKNGAANTDDFGTLNALETTLWMHGNEKYHNSHSNKIEGYSQISPLTDPVKLELLKHWVAHHNEASFGGLAFFATGGACAPEVTLPPESAHAGEEATIEWGTNCNHAMTIVGYCDDVKYDWGGGGSVGNIQPDGEFRNDIDNNKDGVIDVRDWEIGAFNVVGQGSPTYAQEGFVWILYKTVAESDGSNALVLHVDDDYEPLIEIKGEIDHDERSALSFKIARGMKANSSPPSLTSSWKYTFFSQAGGLHPMQGIGNDSWMEFSLDYYGYYPQGSDFGKFFIKLINMPYTTEDATIEYWSIVDRRWGEVFEIQYPVTNIIIPPVPGSTQILAIPYDLIPHETYITSNLTFDSDMVSRFNPTVSNSTLTVDDGVSIDMYESELEILSTSSLVIDDNVTFTAKDGICKITVDGTISIGSGVSFVADAGAQLQLILNNTGLTLSITNGTYDGVAIISYIDDLTISNSDFIDGGIYGFNGDYDINRTDFDNSFVVISDASGNDNSVDITNGCTFTDSPSTMYAVKIDDYPDFTIDNCTFEDNSKGIYIINSGDGHSGGFITDCEITGSASVAIQAYNSDVEIVDNEISHNGYGVKSYNNSNIKLEGTDHKTPSQTIADNTYYEVYASKGSFPYYFHYNAIVDNDNPQPMVYLSGSSGLSLENVTNNYWGTSFNHLTDLYPSGGYIWSPVWDPYNKSVSVAESLYESALEKIELEDYTSAKIDLKEIVSDYYASSYASAALKKLFTIEKFDQNDYTTLKSYLENETAIQQEDELIKIADFLINFCEIKLENWQTAINWFENVIEQPEHMEDSIFAIIDLGNTYLLMQDSIYKSTYAGTMAEHIPANKEQFEEKRDYLLSLLPGDQLSEQMLKDICLLKTGELLQNVPNPFSGTTQLWFKLEEESTVTVDVFDYTGKKVRSYNQGTMGKGSHFFEFTSKGLSAGIYFYSLEVNGKVTDSKKMTLMK